MTQEPQKNNTVLIVIAIIGVVGTIVASAIGAIGNYNTEKMRQEAELTRIALISIVTQGGETQAAMASTISAPTSTPHTANELQLTNTPFLTSLPTETLIPTPTATLFVPPADGILFQDNFDNGINPEWTIYSGSWLVSNGELTMLGDEGDYYEWIGLNKPEWKNYILSLKITIPFQYSASQEYPAIAVRNNGSGVNYLGVPINSRSKIYWAFIGTDQSDTESIAGENNAYGFESGSIVEIEVRGDNYSLRVNGREIQKITIGGYSSGGISLGIMCYDDCPSFDNVTVTYLP